MTVEDLNKILNQCGFDIILNEKPVNSNYSSKIFLQIAHNAIDKMNLVNAIRFLAIAIFLLENE